MRRVDLIIGAIFLIIGINMMLFPSTAVLLFFSGVLLKGLFAFLKYFFKRQLWDLFFGCLSFFVIVLFLAAGSSRIVVALAFWTLAWGIAKIMKALKQKQKGRSKWIANMTGGSLIVFLALFLLIGWFATNAFVEYASMISGVTFVILGLTSIIAAQTWNPQKTPQQNSR